MKFNSGVTHPPAFHSSKAQSLPGSWELQHLKEWLKDGKIARKFYSRTPGVADKTVPTGFFARGATGNENTREGIKSDLRSKEMKNEKLKLVETQRTWLSVDF